MSYVITEDGREVTIPPRDETGGWNVRIIERFLREIEPVTPLEAADRLASLVDQYITGSEAPDEVREALAIYQRARNAVEQD